VGYEVSWNARGDKVEYVDLQPPLTGKDLEEIAKIGKMDRIQARAVPGAEDMIALGERYYSLFPGTGFRLYSLNSEREDLSNLAYLPNARKISIETSGDVENIGVLSCLKELKSLRIHVYLLRDFGFLDGVSGGLEQLDLDTKNVSLDLSLLGRFPKLKTLRLHKYKKNLDALEMISSLESLALRGITPESLDFINKLRRLRLLKIELGGINDFSQLYGNSSISALQLFRISNLRDVEIIARLPNLEAVELSQLRHIRRLPDLSGNKKLKHILLDDMKSLTDFSPLEHAGGLETFSFSVCPRGLKPEDLLPVLRSASVKRCSFFTSSDKKNREIRRLIAEYGKYNDSNFITVRKILFDNFREF
jgi:hypothetical protein